jgi:hypothetical protein
MIKLSEYISVAHPNSVNVIYYDSVGDEITTLDDFMRYIDISNGGGVVEVSFGCEVISDRYRMLKRFFQLLYQLRIPRFNIF